MQTFTVTEDHIKLLRRAYVRWEDIEHGAPAIDSKRPYGNSWVIGDVAEILGVELDEDEVDPDVEERLERLHRETETALQIFLATGEMKAGDYTCKQYSSAWERKDG